MNKTTYIDLYDAATKGTLVVENERAKFNLGDGLAIFLLMTVILVFSSFVIAFIINNFLNIEFKEFGKLLVGSIVVAFLVMLYGMEEESKEYKDYEENAKERTKEIQKYTLKKKNTYKESQAILNVLELIAKEGLIYSKEDKFKFLVSKKDFKTLIKKELKKMDKKKNKKDKKQKNTKKHSKKIVKRLIKA